MRDLPATAHARATLISLSARIKVWRDDAECKLPCTLSSLAAAQAEIEGALSILNSADEAETACERLVQAEFAGRVVANHERAA